MKLEPHIIFDSCEQAQPERARLEKDELTFCVWTEDYRDASGSTKTALYYVPLPADYHRRKAESVERLPSALSDYFCFRCAINNTSGIMRYQGRGFGKIAVLKETFDDALPGGSRQEDVSRKTEYQIWTCDRCGRRREDTLGY